MLGIHLFVSADLPLEKHITDARQLQNMLLEKVFREASPIFMETVSGGEPLQRLCEWKDRPRKGRFEVECVDGILESLTVLSCPEIENLCIRFFPPSLSFIYIERCRQKREFSTRHLPKKALRVSFITNNLYGTPDLSSLPEKIKFLWLSENNLSGPIDLRFLPKSMEILELDRNQISQDVVLYGNLPEVSTLKIKLLYNEIGGLFAIPGTPKFKERNPFLDMKKSQIHQVKSH